MTVLARSIGAVNLNDRVNTFWDDYSIPYTRLVKFETRLDGVSVRSRYARKQATITATGLWIDTPREDAPTAPALGWHDFLIALEGVDAGVFIVGNGWKYVACDVEDCTGKRASVQFNSGALVEAWRWSLKIVSRDPTPVPV